MLLLACSCSKGYDREVMAEGGYTPDKVEVYYFHFTRTCVPCVAIDTETEKTINETYAGALAEGKIAYYPMNIETEEGKRMAEMLDVSGQALLVIKPDDRIDLTAYAILYASNQPEQFRKALRETIGKIK